jgi:hypothetical protein
VRAVAAELERDPALARRLTEVARGLALPLDGAAGEVDDAAPRPSPPVTRRRGGTGRTAAASRQPERDGATPGVGGSPDAGRETLPAAPPARAFRPRVIAGTSPDLGPGIPDPFALRARLGAEGLRAALAGLRLGTLRAIVREHHLDPGATAVRGNDAQKLRTLILDAVGEATTKPRG